MFNFKHSMLKIFYSLKHLNFYGLGKCNDPTASSGRAFVCFRKCKRSAQASLKADSKKSLCPSDNVGFTLYWAHLLGHNMVFPTRQRSSVNKSKNPEQTTSSHLRLTHYIILHTSIILSQKGCP